MKLEFDASKIPGLGTTGDYVSVRIKVHVKFFTPDSCWSWYMTEYDPETREGFGLVCGLEKEFGYFSLDELEGIVGPMGLGVVVDAWWLPKSLADVMKAESML